MKQRMDVETAANQKTINDMAFQPIEYGTPIILMHVHSRGYLTATSQETLSNGKFLMKITRELDVAAIFKIELDPASGSKS
jgi:hypothetical protein